MRLRLYESATASRFVFSQKFIALQLSTFATKSAQSGHVSQVSTYLEPHYLRRLSDGGPDHLAHVIALCPNCHRRVHAGADVATYNATLEFKLQLHRRDRRRNARAGLNNGVDLGSAAD